MSELERFDSAMVPAGPGEDPGEGLEPPEFVVVGIRRPGGVVLFVSNAVTDARFVRQLKGYDEVPLGPRGPVAKVPRIHAIVGVEMTSFEQMLADDYPSALRSLLHEWERKQKAQAPQLPAAGLKCVQCAPGYGHNNPTYEGPPDLHDGPDTNW
jgi:hypothetical protein